jgi:histone H3
MARTKSTATKKGSKLGSLKLSHKAAKASAKVAGVKVRRSEKEKGGIGGIKKPHRFRAGTVALRQIRKYQKSTDLLMPKACFQRLVRQVADSFLDDPFRFKRKSMAALQEATEAWAVELLEKTQRLAIHGKRISIEKKDLLLAAEDHPSTRQWALWKQGLTNLTPHLIESVNAPLVKKERKKGSGRPKKVAAPSEKEAAGGDEEGDMAVDEQEEE